MATGVRHYPNRELLDDGASDAGRLYEAYSDRILVYCLHVLRNRAEAEDAVQTTFLYAQRALQRGVVPLSEYAWLHTIAKNVCRSQQRAAARRRLVLAYVDLDGLPGSSGADDDTRELAGELGDALSSLPENQRRALFMREWQGLSPAEIASRLGLSAPATYALLTRARRSVAQAMRAAGRSALGLNVWPLLLRVKGLATGGVAHGGATAVVATAIAVGGVAIGQAAVHRADAHPRRGPTQTTVAAAPTRQLVAETGPAARSAASPRERVRGRVRTESTSATVVPNTSAEPSGPVSPELPGATAAAPHADVQSDRSSETPGPLLEVPVDPLPLPGLEVPPLPEIVPEEPPVVGGDPLDGLVPEPEMPAVPLVSDPGLSTLP